jgi:hypothetical protein
MATVQKSIDVDVPATIAYNQWTQFESSRASCEGVESVQQIDDGIALARQRRRQGPGVGRRDQRQIPDKRIAWQRHVGRAEWRSVTFHRISDRSADHAAD